MFRAAVKVLTKPATPQPKRRKRSGETRGLFRLTARKIFRRTVQLPPAAYERATAFLADTLDWLNLWHEEPAHESKPDTQPQTTHGLLSLRL